MDRQPTDLHGRDAVDASSPVAGRAGRAGPMPWRRADGPGDPGPLPVPATGDDGGAAGAESGALPAAVPLPGVKGANEGNVGNVTPGTVKGGKVTPGTVTGGSVTPGIVVGSGGSVADSVGRVVGSGGSVVTRGTVGVVTPGSRSAMAGAAAATRIAIPSPATVNALERIRLCTASPPGGTPLTDY